VLHIRLSKDMEDRLDDLISKGIFYSKSEAVREVIRKMILKYKQEAGSKK
jgi:Arc/MetJ-type ribon-helix-helix transcriptional regulator